MEKNESSVAYGRIMKIRWQSYRSSIINTDTQSTVETSKLLLGSNNAEDGTREHAAATKRRG